MQKTQVSPPPTVAAARVRPIIAALAVTTIIGCLLLSLFGYLQPVVIGIVQGVGEFLPISSSAHLILAPWFFGWQGSTVDTLTFDVALHIGTLAAIVIYFWNDWMRLLGAVPSLARYTAQQARGNRAARMSEPAFLLASIIVATIPGAVAGVLLNSWAEDMLRSPLLIAGTLSVVGVLLYVADARQPQARPLTQLRWRDAWLIGLAQACALIPGVSRSGATMTVGRVLQFERGAAARYSFLLSAPITAAAALFKLDEILNIPASEVGMFVVGVLVSALVGALTIHFLLEYIRRSGFGIFAIYRILLALVIIVVYFARGG